MKKTILGVSGMSCSACSNGLEKHLNKQQGILSASVNLVMANVSVEYDETLLSIKDIEIFIKQAGFKSTGLYDINKSDDAKKPLYPLIIFGALAVVLMYVSMGHMINLPVPFFVNPSKNAIGYSVALIILVVPFFIYGTDILVGGVKSLFHKAPNMDTLVTMGVTASFLFSLFYTILIFTGETQYVHNLYFESCATIIFFIKLGRRIDYESKSKTKQAIKDLVTITPNNAVVLRDGQEITVTIDEIIKGDVVVCRAGEKFAVDGVIISGSAHVDESFITGESKPQLKEEDSLVVAGSINYDGYVLYRAEKIGKESTVSEIVKMVVEASNTKMPIAKTADKVCGIFVPSVMAIAFITFVSYLLFTHDYALAIKTFVTVLVVACPCALGLATPLAVVVGEGICAKHGILVKDSKVMEIANKTNVVIFDKTGTLTHGNLRIAKTFNYSNLTDEEVLLITASIESASTHPIGKAFMEKLSELNLSPVAVSDVNVVNGKGITAKIDGKIYIVGSQKILEEFNIVNDRLSDENELLSEGNSIVYLACENSILSLFGVNDTVKPDANALIEQLKANNITPIMLSGDNVLVAEKIANKVGIEKFFGGVMPNDKAKFVNEIKKDKNVVLMCGDGINDSPALVSADIGVSVKNGTDIAMDSSDVILLGEGLSKVYDFIKISKRTLKCIRQNLFWAFFYNVLMIPLACGALSFIGVTINPMLAGLAMVLSSLTVIFNTLRLKFIK